LDRVLRTITAVGKYLHFSESKESPINRTKSELAWRKSESLGSESEDMVTAISLESRALSFWPVELCRC